MDCDRLHCFELGRVPLPLELMIEGGGRDNVARLPMGSILVHSPDGWFLFDLGLADEFRDPAVGAHLFAWGPPELPGSGAPVLETLACCGVRKQDIAGVVLSHLHVDHTGGLRHFVDGPPIFVQRAELEFANSSESEAFFYRRRDYADERLRWHPLDGGAEIAAGITAIPSPGHTVGHMSFRIDMAESGPWLFAYDAIPLVRNVEEDRPTANGWQDAATRRAAHDVLVGLARSESARLVPGHCPRTWPEIVGEHR